MHKTETLYDQLIKALHTLKPVYITDGTVTRLVSVVEHLRCGELVCRLDDGSIFTVYPGFEKDMDGEIGLLETPEGFYLAPLWWIEK